MSVLQAHGLSIDPPTGWEGRIFKRPEFGELATRSSDGPPAPRGERALPVVHLSTIALPPDVADYGGGAVEDLGPRDALIVLKEFDPAEARKALFATEGMPRVLDPNAFDANVLQRTLPGQGGFQAFFHDVDRAFCLYVVLGSIANRARVVPLVNAVLATLTIAPLSAPPSTEPEPTTTTTAPAPGPIPDVTRAQPDLATLSELVAVAGVEATLSEAGPFTLLAPTDAAWAALGDLDELRADAGRLADVLRYHVLGEDVRASSLADTSLPTLAGPVVTLSSTGSALVVNGVAALREVPASNGIVQVLDAVLTPPPA
jgi:uncharacterized surface protein with fasciclin (FAS1) repeats